MAQPLIEKEMLVTNNCLLIKQTRIYVIVFCDIMANEGVSKTYEHFKTKCAVVTCNKIVCLFCFENYKILKVYHEGTMPLSCLKQMLEQDYLSLIPLKNLVASGDNNKNCFIW
jgi:aspartokinase/homoserine dehydrogenase 1